MYLTEQRTVSDRFLHTILATHTHARLMALCPGLPGWASTIKVKPIWILLKQDTVSVNGTSLQTDNHASTPPLRPDALPAAQPTASKHWRQSSKQLLLLLPFNGLFSRTIWVSRYQKGKTNLDFTEQETVGGSGISWAICKSAPRSRQITTLAPYHSVFYRPDALPATQPTASKHWRQIAACLDWNIYCKKSFIR